ncbi:F0F1 ATP synthase subunit B [bacterium]|nr:F0F1 ATP synthase subunit B [bacterium]
MNGTLLLAASPMAEIGGQVLTTIVTFLAVLWVLKLLAWKPILELLDQRRETVSSKFEEIDRKMGEANTLIADYEERLKRIDDEARERHNKAVDEGRQMASEIIEKARHEAESITVKAKQAMDMELEKARLELRREVVEMTLTATGKLLSVSVDDAKHRQLVDDFIADMEKRKSS